MLKAKECRRDWSLRQGRNADNVIEKVDTRST